VAAEDIASRERPSSHCLFPVGPVSRSLYLADDDLDDSVEDLFLVGDVFVERHRLDPEFRPQTTHRQGAEPVSIGQVDGALKDSFSGQRRTR